MASLGPWLGGEGWRGGDPWFRWGMLFSSDIWDPFDWGRGQVMQRRQQGGDDTSVLAQVHVDWQETDKAHIFKADLPGVKKEEVKVQVEDENILQISGERVNEQEDVNDKWHRVERRRGSFVRRFRLPGNADVGNVKCSLDNGVLTVTVPKKETNQEAQRNVRYIDIA